MASAVTNNKEPVPLVGVSFIANNVQRNCPQPQHHHHHHHHHKQQNLNDIITHHHHHQEHHTNSKTNNHHLLTNNYHNESIIDTSNNKEQPNLEIHHPQHQHLPKGHHKISNKNLENVLRDFKNADVDGVERLNNGEEGGNVLQLITQNVARLGPSGDESSYPSGSDESGRRRRVKEESRRKITTNRLNDQKYLNGIEVYSDGADSGVKVTDEGTSEEDQGPPLPPRPPPRLRNFLLDDSG